MAVSGITVRRIMTRLQFDVPELGFCQKRASSMTFVIRNVSA